MLSNKQQKLKAASLLFVQTVQKTLKKVHFKAFKQSLHHLQRSLFNYASRSHLRQTRWLLQGGKFISDQTNKKLMQDKEQFTTKHRFQLLKGQSNSSSKFTGRYSMKSPQILAYLHESQNSSQRHSLISSKQEQKLVCLDSVKDSLSSDSSDDEDETINNFRQQKKRRLEYKNKNTIAEATNGLASATDKNVMSYFYRPMQAVKKQKNVLVQHFAEMEATIRQEQAKQVEKVKKIPRRIIKNNQPQTQRNLKRTFFSLHIPKQNPQQLKHEQNIYLLNTPNHMKLSHGVTLRQSNSKHINQNDHFLGSGTRKKLQFLKNEQINPTKIKLSQLISFKKITTMTNLAYCSSMKTVKDIQKDGVDSIISIDSKQFTQQPSGSRKLIKIANKKIYDQFMIDLKEETSGISLKKTKMKPKNQNKVRFDKDSFI